jgi:hypothetical protein
VVAFDGIPYVWVYKTGPVIDDALIGHATDARIGQSIRLLGYDFEPAEIRPGETIHLTLYWECLRAEEGDYTAFVHLLGPAAELCGQQDNRPQNGFYPTYLWDAGERIEDRYTIAVDPASPSGSYSFAVGLYSLATMERLPVTNSEGVALPDRQILLPGPQIVP